MRGIAEAEGRQKGGMAEAEWWQGEDRWIQGRFGVEWRWSDGREKTGEFAVE